MGLTVTTLVATTLLTASSIISTTSPYSQNWAVQFGTPGHEGIRSLAVDSKGRYYVGGYRDSDDEVPNSGYSTYLQQVEPSGDLGWLRQPSGPLSDSDVSQAMTILDDRVSFITGFNTDVVPELYSFDAAGDLYTTAIEDFPDAASAFAPFSLTADADGSFVVGGIKAVKLNETNSFDVFVSKISNAGQTEWVRTNVFSSFLNGAGYVAVDAQGSIYVAGESSANDVQVEKFDADGVHLWSRTFGTPEQEVVYDITLDAKGHAMVIGTTYGDFGGPSAGREDGFALNVKPNGELDWVTQFGGPGYERAYGVDVAPNGLCRRPKSASSRRRL